MWPEHSEWKSGVEADKTRDRGRGQIVYGQDGDSKMVNFVCTVKEGKGLNRYQSLFLDIGIDSVGNNRAPKVLLSTE